MTTSRAFARVLFVLAMLPLAATGKEPTKEDEKKTEDLLDMIDGSVKDLKGKSIVLYGAALNSPDLAKFLVPIKGTKRSAFCLTFGANRRYWNGEMGKLEAEGINFVGSQALADKFSAYVMTKGKKAGLYQFNVTCTIRQEGKVWLAEISKIEFFALGRLLLMEVIEDQPAK